MFSSKVNDGFQRVSRRQRRCGRSDHAGALRHAPASLTAYVVNVSQDRDAIACHACNSAHLEQRSPTTHVGLLFRIDPRCIQGAISTLGDQGPVNSERPDKVQDSRSQKNIPKARECAPMSVERRPAMKDRFRQAIWGIKAADSWYSTYKRPRFSDGSCSESVSRS